MSDLDGKEAFGKVLLEIRCKMRQFGKFGQF
jgi:hypothetical protein